MIKDLQEAGSRCFNYMVQHGVIMEWRIGDGSLVLTGQYGADKVERHLYYQDIQDHILGKAMEEVELCALKGLSN